MKKRNFGFADLAYAMTYGGIESNLRFYGGSSTDVVEKEYNAEECEEATKIVMLNMLENKDVADALRDVLMSNEFIGSIEHLKGKERLEKIFEYDNANRVNIVKDTKCAVKNIDILKMKRKDLGISDKTISSLFYTRVSVKGSDGTEYKAYAKFDITYEFDWYAFVDRIEIFSAV
jgi:hypothetical protein